MIQTDVFDNDMALAKARRKNQVLYGLSIVHFFEQKQIGFDICEYYQKKMKEFSDCFIWSRPTSLHLTLLRCSSVDKDFSLSESWMHYIDSAFSLTMPLNLKSDGISLCRDGVVRLYFTVVPDSFFSFFDVTYFEFLTGMSYREIKRPWLTLAYSNPLKIRDIEMNISEIQEMSKAFPVFHYTVGRISAVKYEDTAFNIITIVNEVVLGGADDKGYLLVV